jgi:hypothetical protein
MSFSSQDTVALFTKTVGDVSETKRSRYKKTPFVLNIGQDTLQFNNQIARLIDRSVGAEELRKPFVACGVPSLQLKYDPASCLKCNSTLIIDDIDIAGSRVMINRIFKNSLFHDFLLQITFLSPETRTHKLQFSKHDKPLLYHPTHRQILFYHAESAWHMTSPSQGFSSTRGKSLGMRLL